MDFSLTNEEKKILLTTARSGIEAKLKHSNVDYPKPTALLKEKCGAFVSLHNKQALRGCIGYITGIKPLIETIKEMALCAAFSDPRFPAFP